MKIIAVTFLFVSSFSFASALVVSEIMSNPTGDDNGREWIELYNDTSSDIDLASLAISIKGGNAVAATPLQGGTTLSPGSYAIVGSTVSGATKFLQDYPTYSGILFRSSISLVNTGVTSIDIKVGGALSASVPSYTAAKEGATLSLLSGSYVTGTPTPGTANQVLDTSSGSTSDTTTTSSITTTTQVTVAQTSPPSSNILIYMPEEKVAVAGAQSVFSVFSLTREGKSITDLNYTWAFGDGGQGTGSSTLHTYFYSGRYIAEVEALSSTVTGNGRMVVRVVSPDIAISGVGSGKYGSYVDVSNPNGYELDMSGWILSINGASYPFPKNTILPANATVRFAGQTMGFASSTLASSTMRIMFPNLEEVTRYIVPQAVAPAVIAVATATPLVIKKVAVKIQPQKMVLGVATSSGVIAASTTNTSQSASSAKDTRIVSWLKSLIH